MKTRIIRPASAFALAFGVVCSAFLAANAQTQTSAPAAPKKDREATITIVKDGKKWSKTVTAGSDDKDFPEIGDSVRAVVRKALKNMGSFSMSSTNGNLHFSFRERDGNMDDFHINIDGIDHLGEHMHMMMKNMHKMPRFNSFHFSTPRPPRAPRPTRPWVWDGDDRREFSAESAQRLEMEAEALKAEADALRKEAEAMRIEAEAAHKRADALRAEAKAKKKDDGAKPDGKAPKSDKDKKAPKNED